MYIHEKLPSTSEQKKYFQYKLRKREKSGFRRCEIQSETVVLLDEALPKQFWIQCELIPFDSHSVCLKIQRPEIPVHLTGFEGTSLLWTRS